MLWFRYHQIFLFYSLQFPVQFYVFKFHFYYIGKYVLCNVSLLHLARTIDISANKLRNCTKKTL